MPGVTVDGCDIMAVYEAVLEAANHARAGRGPSLVEAMVERYLPHTSDDDDTRYRSREELEEAKKRDPLKILKGQLVEQGILSEDMDKRFHDDAMREINEATDFVDAAPYPDTDDFYEHVYASTE